MICGVENEFFYLFIVNVKCRLPDPFTLVPPSSSPTLWPSTAHTYTNNSCEHIILSICFYPVQLNTGRAQRKRRKTARNLRTAMFTRKVLQRGSRFGCSARVHTLMTCIHWCNVATDWLWRLSSRTVWTLKCEVRFFV